MSLPKVSKPENNSTSCSSAQCPKLQGYLFSPPVPPEKMEQLLRQACIVPPSAAGPRRKAGGAAEVDLAAKGKRQGSCK